MNLNFAPNKKAYPLTQKASFEKLLDSLGETSLAATKAFLAERETAGKEEDLTDEMIASLEKRIDASTE